MQQLADLLNICVSMPNMGSFIFYIIFVFLTPIFLLVVNQEQSILTYLPLLVPLAIIMHSVGKDKVFQNLYPENKDNAVGMTSKYILSTIAIIAILYKMTLIQQESNNVLAVMIGLLNLGLIFIFAPLVIPRAIEKADNQAERLGWPTIHDWHKYTVGFLLLIAILLLEILGSSVLSNMLV